MSHLDDSRLRAIARRRVSAKVSFYIHLACYIACLPLLLWPNLQIGPVAQWSVWPVLGWGLGVAIHGVCAFVTADDWHARLVDAEMERLRRGSGPRA
jgi:hypothetical protein